MSFLFQNAGGGGFSNRVDASLSLAAAGSIAIDLPSQFQTWRIQSTSGEVTLSSTPFGASAPISDGSIVMLIGNSDSNVVNLTANDSAKGVIGNLSTIVFTRGQCAMFIWNTSLDRWVYVD